MKFIVIQNFSEAVDPKLRRKKLSKLLRLHRKTVLSNPVVSYRAYRTYAKKKAGKPFVQKKSGGDPRSRNR